MFTFNVAVLPPPTAWLLGATWKTLIYLFNTKSINESNIFCISIFNIFYMSVESVPRDISKPNGHLLKSKLPGLVPHSKVVFVVADVENHILERVGDSFVTVDWLARA